MSKKKDENLTSRELGERALLRRIMRLMGFKKGDRLLVAPKGGGLPTARKIDWGDEGDEGDGETSSADGV